MVTSTRQELPIASFFDPAKVGELWRVPYLERFNSAKEWAKLHYISPAVEDEKRVCLLLIDVQNTFCLPEFELFVAGRSRLGAIHDNVRLCEFIYRNINQLTHVIATMDTHIAMQIFH